MPPPLGGLQRLAAELPAGLRALGAARLLRSVGADGYLDVVTVGLVEHDVVAVVRNGDALLLASASAADATSCYRVILSITGDGAPPAPGSWGRVEHHLLFGLADGGTVECTALYDISGR